MVSFEDIFRNFRNLFNILTSDIIYEIIYEISFELSLRYIYQLIDEVSLSREGIHKMVRNI